MVTLSGSVRNAREEAVPVYRAGITFKNVSSDTLVKLKDFMRTFGIPDGEKVSDEYPPTALRFRIKATESAGSLLSQDFTGEENQPWRDAHGRI